MLPNTIMTMLLLVDPAKVNQEQINSVFSTKQSFINGPQFLKYNKQRSFVNTKNSNRINRANHYIGQPQWRGYSH